MKNKWTIIMKKNKRLKLTTFQTLTHYGIVLLLLFIVSLTGWSLIEIYLTDTYEGVQTADELIKSLLPIFAIAIIFAIIQYRRLNFKEIQVSIQTNNFRKQSIGQLKTWNEN
jgi:ABC-type Na+ efflux pump permease subunit